MATRRNPVSKNQSNKIHKTQYESLGSRELLYLVVHNCPLSLGILFQNTVVPRDHQGADLGYQLVGNAKSSSYRHLKDRGNVRQSVTPLEGRFFAILPTSSTLGS